MSAWRRWSALAVVLAAGPVLGGCASMGGGPGRLYSLADELTQARADLEGLKAQYDIAPGAFVRNEIIGRRMYIIDVEYSEYEAALTTERQQIGFASSVVQTGLSTAGALVVPATTTKILSGLAAAVGATKGFYDSEVIIAKTLQIAQKQMRANRDKVASLILTKMAKDAVDYPLSAALSDLESYYRAGTLTAGLVEASSTVSEEAASAESQRNIASADLIRTRWVRDAASDALLGYLYHAGPGILDRAHFAELEGILRNQMGSRARLGTIIEGEHGAALRLELARRKGLIAR